MQYYLAEHLGIWLPHSSRCHVTGLGCRQARKPERNSEVVQDNQLLFEESYLVRSPIGFQYQAMGRIF
jgi:hypothetical protein